MPLCAAICRSLERNALCHISCGALLGGALRAAERKNVYKRSPRLLQLLVDFGAELEFEHSTRGMPPFGRTKHSWE